MRMTLPALTLAALIIPAEAADPNLHWFGPGYYEYTCFSDCRLTQGPHATLGECQKMLKLNRETEEALAEDMNGEKVDYSDAMKCDYFADMPADTNHFPRR